VTWGIDRAEGHYDVALVDADGRLMDELRFDGQHGGFATFIELLATAGDTEDNPIR
jgi:hypothetical protein